jgi:hyperosmotically inducible protein
MSRLVPLLLACAAGAPLADRPSAQVSDGSLFERVADAVRTDPQYGVFDSIEVSVEDGAVTLSGRVTDPRKKHGIERRVQQIAGVRSVESDIGVLPLSPIDDDLRYRVAKSIYDHPSFWIHGQRPDPPIHILVEHGRITLTGTANDEQERALAGSLAQVTGSSGVTNRLKVPKPATNRVLN